MISKNNDTAIYNGAHSRYTMSFFAGDDTTTVIDSSWSLTGNLRRYIELNMEDKPVTCLLTHPYPDHIDAYVQFDRIFMNKAIMEKPMNREVP